MKNIIYHNILLRHYFPSHRQVMLAGIHSGLHAAAGALCIILLAVIIFAFAVALISKKP